jgi:hypothetical protein
MSIIEIIVLTYGMGITLVATMGGVIAYECDFGLAEVIAIAIFWPLWLIRLIYRGFISVWQL